jgi:hypothetical protein
MQVTAEYVEQICRANPIPVGHKYTIVMVSGVKRWLAEDIPDEFRLKFLEWLDRQAADSPNADRDFGSAWLTSAMIAVVEPMCDRGWEMYSEAAKIDRGRPGQLGFLDALAKFFPAFAVLNPSLITALEMEPRRLGCFRSVETVEHVFGALLG